MTREVCKSDYEHHVFVSFLDRSGVDVDRTTIRTGRANLNEPDVICARSDGSEIGFELGRLTDPDLQRLVRRWEPIDGEVVTMSNPSAAIASRKLRKLYAVSCPVQLLLYKEDPIITPDDVMIPTIRPLCCGNHGYSKVWFMGKTIEVLYERS